MTHLKGRGAYEIALSLALKHVGLPHYYYELNAALTRALERAGRGDPHGSAARMCSSTSGAIRTTCPTDTVSRQLYKFAFA